MSRHSVYHNTETGCVSIAFRHIYCQKMVPGAQRSYGEKKRGERTPPIMNSQNTAIYLTVPKFIWHLKLSGWLITRVNRNKLFCLIM